MLFLVIFIPSLSKFFKPNDAQCKDIVIIFLVTTILFSDDKAYVISAISILNIVHTFDGVVICVIVLTHIVISVTHFEEGHKLVLISKSVSSFKNFEVDLTLVFD